MASGLRINEDSWKIDVVVEITKYIDGKKMKITKATGEMTVASINKFPDVLLFGGIGDELLQGWELKMPDTPITADDPRKPAEQKARALNLNSFLLWNASDAALFIRDDDDVYKVMRQWSTPEIKTRADVETKRSVWINKLHEIIDTIETLLSGQQIRATKVIDTINGDIYTEYIDDASPRIQELIRGDMRSDREFMAEVDNWWMYEKESYPKDSDKVDILSRLIVVNWMNKFLFAHYLKKYYAVARNIDNMDEGNTLDEGLSLFEEICDQCGFIDIFGRMVGDACIDERTWNMFLELNNYLKTVLISDISPDSLQAMLEKVIDISKREAYGQYTTPKLLAKLLVDITMSDSGELILDPCCGTGTIIKAAEELKKERSIPNYQETIWASDKFSYPLRLTALGLFEPDAPDVPLQIFREDIFDLESGLIVEMVHPRTGTQLEKPLPVFDAIVSNLPFVNYEDLPELEREKLEDTMGKKSDLYAHISLTLSRLVKEGGRVGVIISNSWLYAEWGQQFKEELFEKYTLEKVIISQSGRWFKNAKVVTTILILKKRMKRRSDEVTDFISTTNRIEYWADENVYNDMVTSIWMRKKESESIYLNSYTFGEMQDIASVGLGPMSLFTDAHWYQRLKNKVIPVSNQFNINRGERRGWDKMFYPGSNNNIEPRYLRPVIRSSKNTKRLTIEPDGVAFCCSDSIDQLKKTKATGALSWINLFEGGVNEKGKPLVEVLKKSNMHWYEMSDSTIADLAISMNPGNRICVYRPSSRAFVNQRLIRLTKLSESTDIDLCHALMNSTLGMLMIESCGFGRGEGVLDLSTTRLSRMMMMLDPKLIDERQRKRILDKFESLLHRDIKEIPEEVKMEDRRQLDSAILEAYGLEDIADDIANTLLGIFHIRNAIIIDKDKI